MGVGKDDPFLAVDMLILDALVDGVQRPSENGISDVMRIIQNGSQRRLVPNLLRRSIACPDTT